MNGNITVLVMTLNEEHNLPGCLASLDFADRVVVLDSGSTDATVKIAEEKGAQVAVRPLDDWSSHQNWALDNLPPANTWLLMLDADERADPELRRSLVRAAADPGEFTAFSIARRDWFMGRPIGRVQATPRLIRFFRPERVRFTRLVNPAPLVDGRIGRLSGRIEHYPFSRGLSHWVSRHMDYARLEAEETKAARLRGETATLAGALLGRDVSIRRKHQKALFSGLPGRPLLKFVYLYLIRRGFLDGGPGLAYAVLQSVYEYWIGLESKRPRGDGNSSNSGNRPISC